MSVFESWISRSLVKTAEVRAGSSRKLAGTPVLLFECGSGWYVDGVAAWVSRFSAVFVECIAFRQGDAQQYYRFHQLTKAEVEKVYGKDSSRKLFLWRFEHIVPVTTRQLRVKSRGEQNWVCWERGQLLDMSRGVYMSE